jgi:hypothetical protein
MDKPMSLNDRIDAAATAFAVISQQQGDEAATFLPATYRARKVLEYCRQNEIEIRDFVHFRELRLQALRLEKRGATPKNQTTRKEDIP